MRRFIVNKLSRLLTFVKRFCYYGYIGAKHTYDFDAAGIHTLIEAHISRVSDFMHDSNATHLLWNSNPKNKDMKRLRELKELSKRMVESELSVGPNFKKVCDKYKEEGNIFSRINNPEYKKEARLAIKKDSMIHKGLEDRYWYLLRYKTPHFWD